MSRYLDKLACALEDWLCFVPRGRRGAFVGRTSFDDLGSEMKCIELELVVGHVRLSDLIVVRRCRGEDIRALLGMLDIDLRY